MLAFRAPLVRLNPQAIGIALQQNSAFVSGRTVEIDEIVSILRRILS